MKEIKTIRKLHLIFVLVLLATVATTFLAVRLVQQPQELRKEAAPATSIYFEPSTKQASVGQIIELAIFVNTGGNALYSVFLEINYDSAVLEAQTLAFTNLLPDQLRPVSFPAGKITASAGTGINSSIGSMANPPISGIQKIATVSFSNLKPTSGTAVSFGPQTAAYTGTGADIGVNLIKTSSPATIIVLAPTPTLTPTPRPTATPTPRPTATPTPRPTATPTPRPTSTPTPRPTATPRPTLVPTPTPETNTGTFEFLVELQGAINPPSVLEFKVETIMKGEKTSTAVQVTYLEGGVYQGKLFNLQPGTYDFVIKPPRHLSVKFKGVNIKEGENKQGREIVLPYFPVALAGDATQDNKINIQDFRVLAEDYLKTESPADFNFDGKVNIQDFRFIVENYLEEGEE